MTTKRSLTKKSLTKKVQPPAPAKRSLAKKTDPPVPSPEPTVVLKTGPVPAVPKGFKWVGDKDSAKSMKGMGFKHIKPADMPDTFPKPNPSVPANTFWRVNPKTNEVISLVTVLPTGVHVAWSECSICMNSAKRCVCRRGFMHTRGIEWLYIRARLQSEGVTVTNEPHIDTTHFEVTSRALYWYRGKETGRVPNNKPVQVYSARKSSGGTQTPQTPARPADRAKRSLTKPAARSLTAKKAAANVEPLDMGKLNQQASSRADDVAADLARKLNAKPKKSLTRKKG